MPERIQKVLASAGVASRRAIEQMILEGRIAVNGKTVYRLPVMIEPGKDRVTVDGQGIRLSRNERAGRVYVMMHKPRGVYCTNVAQGVQKRAIDLLPEGFPRVFPVGRLEADSTGLLLLTNDGELVSRLTHARYKVPKGYRVVVDGEIDKAATEKLQAGIWLADPRKGGGFKTGKCRIKTLKRTGDRSLLEITSEDGRNLELRRAFAKFGHKLRDVMQTRLGPLSLGDLRPGEHRALLPKEIKLLRQAVRAEKPDQP